MLDASPNKANANFIKSLLEKTKDLTISKLINF